MNESEAVAYHAYKYKHHTFYIHSIEEYDRLIPIIADLNARIICDRRFTRELLARKKEEFVQPEGKHFNLDEVAINRIKYKRGYKVHLTKKHKL